MSGPELRKFQPIRATKREQLTNHRSEKRPYSHPWHICNETTNARDFLSRASTARNAHLDLVSLPMIGHLSPILCSYWLIEAPKPQLWILQILSSMNDSKNNSRFKTTASEWFVHHLMKSFHSNFSPLRTDIKT